MENLLKKLTILYGDTAKDVFEDIKTFILFNKSNILRDWISEKDIMLITYGDSIMREGEAPLQTLNSFLKEFTKNSLSAIHLLPMFPYTSDDGFSVVDYKKIDPLLGDWNNIENLSKHYLVIGLRGF